MATCPLSQFTEPKHTNWHISRLNKPILWNILFISANLYRTVSDAYDARGAEIIKWDHLINFQ